MFGTCEIWNTQCEVGKSGELSQFNSPRAGGAYCITASAKAMLATRSPEFRAKLATWIVDQHRMGEEWPTVNSALFPKIEAQRLRRTSEKKARFFQWLISTNHRIGTQLDIFGATGNEDLDPIAAWIEAKDHHELIGFGRLLRAEGIVSEAGGLFELTPLGFKLLEDAEMGGAPTNQAFVAMWFSDATEAIYEDAIAPAIGAAGFKPFRIDKKEHTNKIDDEIIAEIRRSRFVVADFTCGLFEANGEIRSEPRGGVYYEAGFAQGLRTPVIWTVRSDCIAHVHFDTRQFAHIVWDDAPTFRNALYNRIASVIGTLPGAPRLTT